MANANPQAVAFCNNRVRPFADQLYACYLTAKSLLAQWNAQSVATVIPNDATVIADGAAADGRPLVTNAQATNVINRAQDIINWMEGSVTIPAGIGSAVLTSVAAVQVNGRASF